MATVKRKKEVVPQSNIVVGEEDIGDFIIRNMTVYGHAVNMDRSVPGLYDGFKPVHRRAMYAARSLARGMVKTARVSGATTGAFHPHGEGSVEGAVATLVNMPLPPLYGHGNWGTLTDIPAAARYTNVKISAYGWTFLDSDYLAVTPHTPNYDDKEAEPITLPALLPNLLLNGTYGIGVGVTTSVPAFTLKSVLIVLIKLLEGRELQPDDYASTLVLASPYGGTPVRSKANFDRYKTLFTSSKGSLKTEGVVDANYDKRQILVSKFPINFSGDDVDTFIETARNLVGVKMVYSGRGISWVVTTERRIEEEEFDAITRKVQALLTKSISYSIYVTNRTPRAPDETTGLHEFDVTFQRLSIPELVEAWLSQRLSLEKAVCRFRINKCRDRLAYLKLMIHAAQPRHIDIIAAALKHTDSKERIAKGLKITIEQAEVILGLKVSQLARLSIEDTETECAKLQDRVALLRTHLKDPTIPVLAQMKEFRAQATIRPRDAENWNCLQTWLSPS